MPTSLVIKTSCMVVAMVADARWGGVSSAQDFLFVRQRYGFLTARQSESTKKWSMVGECTFLKIKTKENWVKWEKMSTFAAELCVYSFN